MTNIPPCLFISGFLPSQRVPSGGQKLVSAVLRQKASETPTVLLAFSNEREGEYLDEKEFSFCQEAKVFSLSKSLRLRAIASHPGLPLATSARYAAAAKWLDEACTRYRFSEVWVEFMQGASLLERVPASIPSTLVVHDMLHQGLERRVAEAPLWIRWALRWECRRTRRWESTVLKKPSHLVTLTEKDRDLIRVTSGRMDVEVRYPVVDARFAQIRRTSAGIDPGTILFWGQMSRRENADAAIWFARTILPRIRAQHPSARFLIAGADPGPEVRELAGEAVEVLGFVPDPLLLFSRVELAVAPLRLGSGIKIKVIEYLAAGIPTVCTPIGAEGVRSDPLLSIAETDADFVRECCAQLG